MSEDDRLDAFEQRLDSIANIAVENDEEITELREENQSLRLELKHLREELADVQDQTDMLKNVRKAAASSREEKVAIVLMNIREKAQQHGEGRMDPEDIVNTLQNQIERTTAYSIMDAAVEMVEDKDILYVDRYDRHDDRNTALVMDRAEGDLPPALAGYDLRQGGTA